MSSTYFRLRTVASVIGVLTVVFAVWGAFADDVSAQQSSGSDSTYPEPAKEMVLRTEGAGVLEFLQKCAICHGRIKQAPSLTTLQSLEPEKIYDTMTKGAMRLQAANLTDEQRIKIAEWLGGRRLGGERSGDAKDMSNRCASNGQLGNVTGADSWNGWSPNQFTNSRFQPARAAELSPAGTARLELKWGFGMPATTSAYGQPTVAGGRIFIGSDSGYLYSLDARSGCVHWSFRAQAGLRSTPMIAASGRESAQSAVFVGDIRGNVYSLDASNGALLWKVSVDANPNSRITGAVNVFQGRVYVPVANLDEDSVQTDDLAKDVSADHESKCCTSRGIVVALDAATGRQIWKTYTISEPASPRKTAKGVSFLGPSGASVWGPLTLDPKRRAIYLGTGNAFSEPDVGRSDAVMAMSLDTGKILWVQQVEHDDVYQGWCTAGPPPPGFPLRSAARKPGEPPEPAIEMPQLPADYYCPDVKDTPDYDISAGQMLVDLPGGRSLVVAGQKSGVVWALDPDRKGALIWKSDISRGEIVFGGATDGVLGYFGMRGGALAAVRLTDGVEQWAIWIDPQSSMDSHRGVSAAVSVIPGVVFVPCLDGTLRAYSTFDGRSIWQYDTTQKVATVNGIAARGGSIGSAGAVIVGGMVFVTSGYIGYQSGQPGNLLLAFGAPEK